MKQTLKFWTFIICLAALTCSSLASQESRQLNKLNNGDEKPLSSISPHRHLAFSAGFASAASKLTFNVGANFAGSVVGAGLLAGILYGVNSKKTLLKDDKALTHQEIMDWYGYEPNKSNNTIATLQEGGEGVLKETQKEGGEEVLEETQERGVEVKHEGEVVTTTQ